MSLRFFSNHLTKLLINWFLFLLCKTLRKWNSKRIIPITKARKTSLFIAKINVQPAKAKAKVKAKAKGFTCPDDADFIGSFFSLNNRCDRPAQWFYRSTHLAVLPPPSPLSKKKVLTHSTDSLYRGSSVKRSEGIQSSWSSCDKALVSCPHQCSIFVNDPLTWAVLVSGKNPGLKSDSHMTKHTYMWVRACVRACVCSTKLSVCARLGLSILYMHIKLHNASKDLSPAYVFTFWPSPAMQQISKIFFNHLYS